MTVAIRKVFQGIALWVIWQMTVKTNATAPAPVEIFFQLD